MRVTVQMRESFLDEKALEEKKNEVQGEHAAARVTLTGKIKILQKKIPARCSR